MVQRPPVTGRSERSPPVENPLFPQQPYAQLPQRQKSSTGAPSALYVKPIPASCRSAGNPSKPRRSSRVGDINPHRMRKTPSQRSPVSQALYPENSVGALFRVLCHAQIKPHLLHGLYHDLRILAPERPSQSNFPVRQRRKNERAVSNALGTGNRQPDFLQPSGSISLHWATPSPATCLAQELSIAEARSAELLQLPCG